MREYTQEERKNFTKQQLLNEETKKHIDKLTNYYKNNPLTKQEKEEGLKKAEEFEQVKDTIQIKIKELKKEQLKIYNIFFDKATEKEEENYKKTNSTNVFYTIFFDTKNKSRAFLEVTEEDFIESLTKEIEILQESTKIKEQLSIYEKSIKKLFFSAENPYFEGMQKEEKEDYFNKISFLFSEIFKINNQFCEIFTSYNFIIDEELFFEVKNGINLLKDIESEIKRKQEEGKDFKDIKIKNQAVSMYRPTQKIFLEGEEISKIYKEQAIVNIPFGLKEENKKDVNYQITSLNYNLSDKDLKVFNACLTAQWNLLKNKYPVETFIDEDTLYQIYIGDTSFTYRPRKTGEKNEIKPMHDSIMGLATIIAKLQFTQKYDYLDEKSKRTYSEEGAILPIKYITDEKQMKNGQIYTKRGYKFLSTIPLLSFMNELRLINTAPLEIESFLKSSQMNNEITRVLKEEIAQLYYFKNNNQKNDTKNGYKQKNFVCEHGELTTKQWNEEKTKNKKLTGYWKYSTRRTIDSLIYDCQFANGKTQTKKNLDSKTRSRFIDSVITFLRESKKTEYAKNTYIKDFILYDKNGKIVKDSNYITEKQKKIKKKSNKRNPSIDKIDIIIT